MIDLLFDDLMVAHDPGPGHPERPDRLAILRDGLDPLLDGVPTRWVEPVAATRADVARIHAEPLLDALEGVRGKRVQLDPDTALSEKSLDAAYLAAGAAIGAANRAFTGECDAAIALVRPPGHHAERHRPMGFCLFNNIAVAAEHVIAAHGLERVLIVDWDVHHGNGTQHSFYDRRDVLFVSSHRFPFYPGTGALGEVGTGAGTGYSVNLPLPAGMDDGDYALAFESIVAPVAQAFDPQLILVSAGFDAHALDPLGGMRVSSDGFATLCSTVKALADECCDGKLALVLEGGYSLRGLAEGVAGCARVLAGETPPERPTATPRGERIDKELRQAHHKHWPSV